MSQAFQIIAVSLAALTSAGAMLVAQQPRITNGRVTQQPAGSPFVQSVRSLVGAQADVAWIGYEVPVVDNERIMCCFSGDTVWVNGSVVMSDGRGCCRACRLEPPADGSSMATRSPNTGPVVRLQGSERMVVLLRVAERQIDRVRVFSEDCELDAGGRPVIWLDPVRAADSIAMLETLVVQVEGRRDRVPDAAISAIALHGDSAADASLERLVAASQPEAIRRKVTFWLGQTRGQRGVSVLKRLLADDASIEVRKSAIVGIGQSRDPGAIDLLTTIARKDADTRLRGEALFWLAQRAGQKAAATITDAIEQDPDTEVKKRAVFALSQFPKNEGVPLLIQVARTNTNPAVRKQAMFWLGQSKDPRAVEFFAEILKPR